MISQYKLYLNKNDILITRERKPKMRDLIFEQNMQP